MNYTRKHRLRGTFKNDNGYLGWPELSFATNRSKKTRKRDSWAPGDTVRRKNSNLKHWHFNAVHVWCTLQSPPKHLEDKKKPHSLISISFLTEWESHDSPHSTLLVAGNKPRRNMLLWRNTGNMYTSQWKYTLLLFLWTDSQWRHWQRFAAGQTVR